MNQSLKMEPNVKNLFHYIEQLQKGYIQVPAFQRDFIWSDKNKLDLFDSIKKGYPIGCILLWKPNVNSKKHFEGFQSDKMGAYTLPKPMNEHPFSYILDGYQRLSTLFGCLVNPSQKVLQKNEKEWQENFNIIYDLEADTFEINKKDFDKLELWQVPIYRLIDGKEFFSFQRKLIRSTIEESKQIDYIEKYENISSIFLNYQLPSIQIIGDSITEAVDIFARLNTTGAPISMDWIVSALSFNPNKHFRLGTEINNLLLDLEVYNFQGLKRELIFQCIMSAFGKNFLDTKQGQLELLAKRPDFIDVTRKALKSIAKTIQFLFEELLVLQSNLLPYNSQLIFMADFFNKLENPTEHQLKILKKWFWVTSYASYFTMYNLSRQRKAYDQFQAFIEDEEADPIYMDKPHSKFIVAEFPTKMNFGSVRATSLALFMLNYLNQFKNVKTEDVQGYKTYNLFSEGISKEDKYGFENSILWIDWDLHRAIPKKEKNLSFWLNSDENHDAFFITETMKDTFRKGASQEEILQIRKDLIMKAEKAFVEQLGLTYRMTTEESES